MAPQHSSWLHSTGRLPAAPRRRRHPHHGRKVRRLSGVLLRRRTDRQQTPGLWHDQIPLDLGVTQGNSPHRPRRRFESRKPKHGRPRRMGRLSRTAVAVVVAFAIVAGVVVLPGGSVSPTPGRALDMDASRTNSMRAPPGFSHKIFQDSFRGRSLDKRKWNTYITSKATNGGPWNSDGSGGSGINPGGYNAEYFQPRQVSVDDGLVLTAVRGSTRSGYAWTSGVVSTFGKFQFDGGYVQIKAKMPSGDGMWPGLWMLPGPGGSAGDNFELDIFEGNYLGNGVNPNDNDAWNLHTLSVTEGGVTNTGWNLAGGYHIYGMNWIPGRSVTWYFDGRQVGSVTSAQVSIPDEPMELIMDLQVASSKASGFVTTSDGSTPSPSTMEIAQVQVFRSRSDRRAAK